MALPFPPPPLSTCTPDRLTEAAKAKRSAFVALLLLPALPARSDDMIVGRLLRGTPRTAW